VTAVLIPFMPRRLYQVLILSTGILVRFQEKKLKSCPISEKSTKNFHEQKIGASLKSEQKPGAEGGVRGIIGSSDTLVCVALFYCHNWSLVVGFSLSFLFSFIFEDPT